MMAPRLLITTICCLLLGIRVNGYEHGAPDEDNAVDNACIHMSPEAGHGVAPMQTNLSPFEVKTNTNCYKPGQEVQVVVRTKSGEDAELEGVFIQCRKSGVEAAFGSFTVTDDKLKKAKCNANAAGAVTHKDEFHLHFVEAQWTPPSGETGDVTCFATCVKGKTKFFVKVPSEVITHKADCEPGEKIQKPKAAKKANSSGAATQRFIFTTIAVGIITTVVFVIKQ